MKHFVTLILFVSLVCKNAFAQSYSIDSIVTSLLDEIQKEQILEKEEFYPGMFYSFRGASAFPHRYRPDNNVFFTAIGSFTLKNLQKYLDKSNAALIDTILNRSSSSIPYFQNKKGLPFYNFWPTGGRIMPHSLIAQHLTKQFTISEDADDTVMILMSLLNNDSANIVFKKRLMEVSNLGTAGKQIRSTYKRFRKHKAYTTYLGYKMQTDFDMAVQCNIMYFVLEKKLPFAEQDSATLQLLAEMTKERLYMKKPIFVSPYYGSSSLIIYHLTRLMAGFHPQQLEACKATIIQDAQSLIAKTRSPLEKVILKTSLLRLGAKADFPTEKEIAYIRTIQQRKFSFFQARPAYWCRPWLKSIFLHLEGINYNFYSPTHDKILLLENLVLQKRFSQQSASNQ